MTGRVDFQPKSTTEIVKLAFDFISVLGSETISTKVVTASVWSGTDANPSAIINGAASHVGTIVTQSITGGVAGVIYELLCTITTSGSQTLTLRGLLAVMPSSLA